jgi:hypothetical protein
MSHVEEKEKKGGEYDVVRKEDKKEKKTFNSIFELSSLHRFTFYHLNKEVCFLRHFFQLQKSG